MKCLNSVCKYVVPYAGSCVAASTPVYFFAEYHYSRQNLIILFWNYLADIRNDAWLNLFWK
jgi:hypothetical protein